MDFEWSIKDNNETINLPDKSESSSGQAASFLKLSDNFNVQRTYRCAANNSVGIGTMCEIEVAGKIQSFSNYFAISLFFNFFVLNYLKSSILFDDT